MIKVQVNSYRITDPKPTHISYRCPLSTFFLNLHKGYLCRYNVQYNYVVLISNFSMPCIIVIVTINSYLLLNYLAVKSPGYIACR